MKYLLTLSLCLPTLCWSKSQVNFTKALTQDVQEEIKRDEDKFRKVIKRGPASVQEVEPVIEDNPKLDKQVRQIGPNKW